MQNPSITSQQAYDRIKDWIIKNPVKAKESAVKINLKIKNSELNAGNGNYTRTLQIPKIFTHADKKAFERAVETTYGIFQKTIDAYRKDEKVRDLFPFDERLQELILLPVPYPIDIPICRIDIFYNEKTGDYKFCEFNTDGTSAMNENQRLNEFLEYNTPFHQAQLNTEYMELMDSWADKLLENYAQTPNAKQNPHIAMVDFLENAYISEFYRFEELFKKRGYSFEVLDIRDMEYKDGKLISKKTGQTIDLIYRRAVTRDVMDHYDEIQPFIQAVKDGNIVIEGAFQTQIVHHKAINQALMNDALRKYFTKEEKEFLDFHLPKTYDLTHETVPMALEHKDQWIIKPKDSYAAKGVFAGVDLNEKEWAKVVEEFADKDYILQEYVVPYKSENVDLLISDEFKRYTNLSGLYTYNGKLAGVYSRLSESGIISTQYNEKMIPTLFLLEESLD